MGPSRSGHTRARRGRRLANDAAAFSARLRRTIDERGTLESFAREAGVTSNAIRKWLKGESQPSRHRLIAAARAAGVSVEWLATGHGRPEIGIMQLPHPTGARGRGKRSRPEYVFVSEVGARVRRGEVGRGRTLLNEIAFKADWLKRSLGFDPRRLLALQVDSGAQGIGLADGDIVLLDSGDTRLADDGLYALRISETIAVRRVHRRMDGSVVVSSGSDRPSEEIVPCSVDSLDIIGRVVWICRRA